MWMKGGGGRKREEGKEEGKEGGGEGGKFCGGRRGAEKRRAHHGTACGGCAILSSTLVRAVLGSCVYVMRMS